MLLVGLYVNNGSVLSAEGTAATETTDGPITMTATEGNGQQGWWNGVFVFSDNANNLLNHVEVRHAGGDSPNSVDDAQARRDWDWEPQYGLSALVEDMLQALRDRVGNWRASV